MEFISINGYKIIVDNWDYTVLQQCELLKINVPRFCYHDRLSIAGNCRMCMVELETSVKPLIACSTGLVKGMSIYTNSTLVKKARENVLEFLLINHPLDCPICDQGGECDLQDQSIVYGGDRGRFKEAKRSVSDKNLGPFVKTIMTRCIHCTRCIRFCDEILGVHELGAMGRGNATEIGTYIQSFLNSELSGNVVDLCPVGALTSKPYAFSARPWELESIESIDIFDALGSNLRMDVKGNTIMRILPKLNEQLNEEWITDKVRYSHDGLMNERLTWPMYKHNGKFMYSSWEFALSLVTIALSKLTPMEPRSLGVYVGELLDLATVSYIDQLTKQLGCAINVYSSVSRDVDSRFSVMGSSQLSDISRFNSFLLLNVDPKKESSVFNAKLRQLVRSSGCKIFYVGPSASNNVSWKHLSLSSTSFYQACLGKNFGDVMSLGSTSLVLFNHISSSSVSLAQTLGGDFSYSYLPTDSSEINIAELGLTSKFSSSTNDVAFMVNTDSKFAVNAEYKIYMGHHGTNDAFISDLILPMSAYTEYEGIYLNMYGLLQKSNKITYIPGQALEPSTILSLLSSKLSFSTRSSLHFNLLQFSRIAISDFRMQKDCAMGSQKILRSTVSNFYRTNIISRYSINMLKASKSFLNSTNNFNIVF